VNGRFQLGVYIVTHFVAGDAELFRVRELERCIKGTPENHSCEKSTKDEDAESNH
jgi:hypothetical protein